MEKKRGAKKGKFTWLIILIFLAVLLVTVPIYLNSKKGQIEEKRECRVDSDCVKVQTTCCPCSSGGEEVCVAASKVSDYQPEDCPAAETLMCIALYNCKIKNCACLKGQCEIIPPETE